MRMLWTFLALKMIHIALARLPMKNVGGESVKVVEALNAVLGVAPRHRDSILILKERHTMFGEIGDVRAPRGVGIFEVVTDGQGSNGTQAPQLSYIAGLARQLRFVSWPLTVVVVSDDPAFLATFAEWSLKGRLLVWPTRLLVLTRLPLHHLHQLRNTLAMTNSMLLHVTHISNIRIHIYVELPYRPTTAELLPVASSTPIAGLKRISTIPYYPDKFSKFPNGPRLTVSRVVLGVDKTETIDDLDVPGEKKVIVFNPENYLIESIAKQMNFKIKYIPPKDNGWGARLGNGSWTGMIGDVHRKEADIGLGLFIMTLTRHQVVDFIYPASFTFSSIFAARGSPEVDPWSFFLSLTPLVWVGILATVIVLVTTSTLLLYCFPHNKDHLEGVETITGSYIRVLLQQDVSESAGWWSWERVMLGVWMLMTLVLTKSYASNLMSQLAVRYVPHPLQTLEDVLDSSFAILIYKGSSDEEAFKVATSGTFKNIWDLKDKNRLELVGAADIPNIPSMVKQSPTTYFNTHAYAKMDMAMEFSKTGKCEFYIGNSKYRTTMASFAVSKDSPLLPMINRKVMEVSEGGLYDYWIKQSYPNYTSCLNPPTKFAISSTLAISNIWGMFVVLGGGMIVSLLVFFVEIFNSFILH